MTDQLSLARVLVGSVIGASPQDGLVIEIIRALDQQRLIAPHDVRDRLHAKCDCVPNLGPAHCHLCEHENGTPTPWEQCSAVTGPSRDYAGEIEQAAILAPLSDDEYGQGFFRGLCRAADIVRGNR